MLLLLLLLLLLLVCVHICDHLQQVLVRGTVDLFMLIVSFIDGQAFGPLIASHWLLWLIPSEDAQASHRWQGLLHSGRADEIDC